MEKNIYSQREKNSFCKIKEETIFLCVQVEKKEAYNYSFAFRLFIYLKRPLSDKSTRGLTTRLLYICIYLNNNNK